MKFLSLILKHPRLILIALIALALGGVHLAHTLSVDVFPDIHVPRVVIQTEAGGLTAEEVEQRITIPIESAVNGIPGVRTIRSSSSGGLSFVWIDFDWAQDLAQARFAVFERLARVKESLPPEAESEIAPDVSVTGEIMLVALTWNTNSVSDLTVREGAEYDLRNRLLAVPGIGEVVVTGGELPEYRIAVNPHRLLAEGLTWNDVIDAASQASTYSSAGALRHVAGEELPLRQKARAETLVELARLPVKPPSPVRLGEITTLTESGTPRCGSASFNGQRAVILSIQKIPGGNTPRLTEALNQVLSTYQHEVASRGIEVHREAYRQADFIELSLTGAQHVLRDAILVVILVLGLTLLRVRTLFIVLLSIPLSALLAITLFPVCNLGVNVMTLGGFAIAAGDVVDAAIIFTEVIWRRLAENSLRPRDQQVPISSVIAQATYSVLPGVLFSTAIVVLVFSPLLFLSGLEGRFFRPLALSFLLVFSSSFAVALLAVPTLSKLLWRTPRKFLTHAGDSVVVRCLKALYKPLLNASLRWPAVVALAALLLCGYAFYHARTFGSSFLPPFHEDSFNVALSLPPGTSLEESERVAEAATFALAEIPGVKSVARRTGRAERDQHAEPVSSSEYVVRIDMNASSSAIRNAIRKQLGSIPGCSVLVGYPIAHRISAVLSGTEAELALNIYGDNLERLRTCVHEVNALLPKISGVSDVRANREILIRTLRITYDLDALASEGLTPRLAGEQVSAAFYGLKVGEIRTGLVQKNLVVRLENVDQTDVSSVENLLLMSPTGRTVPLKQVAQIVPELASNLLLREGGRRKALISCNPAPETNTGDLVKNLQQHLSPIVTKQGCTLSFGGSYQARESAARRLAILGVGLLVLIFVLVFAAVGSVRASCIALVNIPLGLVGGILAVSLGESVLSVSSLVGFITVSGFTLRNGILLLKRYKERQEEGEDFLTAVREGSLERMVPILMTSLTTVIGLIPLILAHATPGGELLAPLAVVQLGGILGATALNLLVLPATACLVQPRTENAS